MKTQKYKMVDLFCGAGGMSLGFEQTKKFEVALAIDHWKPAIDTFKHNHPKIDPDRIICDDLINIFDKKWVKDKIKKPLGDEKIDVVVGGPPCQGLSLAGKRLSNDPRNQLFKCFVKTVEILKPKIFIMENVPGLLSAENGKINDVILGAFKDIGYDHFESHQPLILKSEMYGVPQARRRLFYVGFPINFQHIPLVWGPKPTHKNIGSLEKKDNFSMDLFAKEELEETLINPVTCFEAISDLPKLKSGEGCDQMDYCTLSLNSLTPYQMKMRDWKNSSGLKTKPAIFNHEAPRNTEKLVELIKSSKPGKSVDPKYSDSKKLDPNLPAFTVKALGAGGGSTNRRAFHYDPLQPRGTTIRENARLQSFPDYYRFLSSKTNQMTQVGNAVPPLLAKAIAKSVISFLKDVKKCGK
jgi:DNA (cytosine-5)-methyltransferase 1